VPVTDDATGIDNPAQANDFEANDVDCQTDPKEEDELLRQY